MNYNLEGDTKVHRRYQLQKMANEFELTGEIPATIYVADDPHIINLDQVEEALYACGSCNRKLFLESNVIEHEPNQARTFRNGGHTQCDSIFIEPISWMTYLLTPKSGELSLDLRCPNHHCQQVLGTWYFGSTDCSCLAQVQPAFRVKKHRVTKFISAKTTCTYQLPIRYPSQSVESSPTGKTEPIASSTVH